MARIANDVFSIVVIQPDKKHIRQPIQGEKCPRLFCSPAQVQVSAKNLAAAGHTVYGAARRVEKLEELRPFGVIPLQLDITDEDSIKKAVETIITEQGRIDALVNNAGYGSYGAIEDVTLDEARNQFEVNLFGLARLTQLILPQMRAQRSGRIINVSSMGGRLTTFMGAWYHATKYALEAFSDALRMETSDFGIQVSIIEPGGIKTDWGMIAADKLEESAKGGAYESIARKTAENMRRHYSSESLSDPAIISKAITHAIEAKKPKTRYLIGFMAKPAVLMHAVLPDRTFDKIIRRFM